MAGWRVGMLCGAKERIDEVLRFKSNMDSGMFLPVQLAAAKALALGKEWYDEVNNVYNKAKRKSFCICWISWIVRMINNRQACLCGQQFLHSYQDGFELSDEVLYKANVFITPGGIFGNAGDEYMRVSLCSTIEKIEEAIQNQRVNRIKASRNLITRKLKSIAQNLCNGTKEIAIVGVGLIGGSLAWH